MKRRALASPDLADALALTYARPVFPRNDMDWTNGRAGECITAYNPFSNESIWDEVKEPRAPRYYEPGYATLRPEFE